MADLKLSTNKNTHLTEEDVKFLVNELRKSSVIWSGRKEILQLARRKVFVRRAKNGNAVYKYKWQCAPCLEWYANEKELEVDHIKEVGPIEFASLDWNDVIRRVFPRPVEKYLQVLCIRCHMRKTNAFNSARSKWKRKVQVEPSSK